MLVLVLTFMLVAVASSGAAQPTALPPLPLAEAVARARDASPVGKAARAVAEGAATAAQLAGRPLNPLVDVRVENLAPRRALTPDLDIFAVVTQPIELAGRRAARRDSAGADRDVTALLLRTVERQVALDTVRAYMRAVRARDVLTTLRAQAEGVATLVVTMRRRVEEGFAPESDLLRFEAESARMTTEIARTDIELTRALMDLAALMAGAPVDGSQLVTPPPVDPPDAAGDALAAAIARRPDVLLAAARVEAARVTALIEHQRRWPAPAVSAGYKRTQGQDTAVAGVMVAVPLFDQNGQARAVADAGLRAAASDRDAVQARAVAEASAAVSAAEALARQASGAEQNLLIPAGGVRSAAQAMFREGAADVLKLVDAERIYTDVQREARMLAADAYLAAIEARFALGQEDIP